MPKTPNILLIGPKLHHIRKNVGGATRYFGYLIRYFVENNIAHQVIDTHRFAGTVGRIRSLFHFLLCYIRFVWKSNVVFLNVSQDGIRFLAPMLFLLSRSLGKKVVIRPFGGALKAQYEDAGPFVKWIFSRTTLRADILYLQTELLMDFFRPLSRNIQQLNTSRYSPDGSLLRGDRPYQKRCLFVGHIKRSKGVDELIAAMKLLDDAYTVDLYGPIREPAYEYLSSGDHPFYKGILEGEEQVLSVMSSYDVLVLPTYYEGEGYPGVIVEAYSLGLPVITTRWKAIPEIVEHGTTGILIPPRSVEALVEALTSFDRQNHMQMSQHAKSIYRSKFEANAVMDGVLEDIKGLL